jgi:hypothetical protein
MKRFDQSLELTPVGRLVSRQVGVDILGLSWLSSRRQTSYV